MVKKRLSEIVIFVHGFPFRISHKIVEPADGDTYADIYRKSGLKHDIKTQIVLEYDSDEVGMDACPEDYFSHYREWNAPATPGQYLFLFPRSLWEKTKKEREEQEAERKERIKNLKVYVLVGQSFRLAKQCPNETIFEMYRRLKIRFDKDKQSPMVFDGTCATGEIVSWNCCNLSYKSGTVFILLVIPPEKIMAWVR
jgi:hypothetical protein